MFLYITGVAADGKKMWSSEEKMAVQNYFAQDIRLLKVPGKVVCCNCIQQNPILCHRSWKNIKDCTRNLITAYKRQQNK